MNEINSNTNKYRLNQAQIAFKANEQVQLQPSIDMSQVQIPDLYNTADRFQQQSFKETVKQADMMGLIYPWIAHPLMMLGTCTGLAYGVDKFSKACGGDYEKSLLAKAANLGDNIENSKFVQSKEFQKVLGWGNDGVKKVNHFFRNSDLINAIKTTPSMPEWSIVKQEMFNQGQRLTEEFSRITEALHLNDDNVAKLKDLGLDKAEKDFIKQKFGVKNVYKAPEIEAVNTILLKRLGKSESEISSIIGMGDGANQAVKNEILNELGISKDLLEKIKKEGPAKYVDDVQNAVSKVKGKVKIGAGHYSFLGPIQPFERTIGCDELFNRFHSMTVGGGAKTSTGRFMSKFLQKLHRGFTFGGGKLGVLAFVSPLIVETMLDVGKADKEQKVGTAVHGLVESVSWVFTFPIALKIMHSLAGAQYAGMGKDKVDAYRNKIAEFNQKAMGNDFKSLAEYKDARKILEAELKELKKVDGQNLLTKICRKLGSFVTMDLETIKSYRNGTVGGNFVRKIPNFFKNLGGVPMRLALWGCISTGVLGAAITKTIKMLFGNYYDRYKEEEYDAKKAEQKKFLKEDLQKRLLEIQARKLQAAQTVQTPQTIQETQDVQIANVNSPLTTNDVQDKNNEINQAVQESQINPFVAPKEEIKTPDQKIVEPVKEKVLAEPFAEKVEIQEPKYIPNQNSVIKPNQTVKRDNYTYIPSSENVLNKDKKAQENKYIPSQVGAKFNKTFDNSGLQGALARADRAEKRALETLAGNFDGMY